MTEHIQTCAQLEWKPCLNGTNVHRWSGWPGAWCQDCGIEDKTEACLGGCECPCHDSFWEEYAEYLRKEREDGL